MIPSATHAVPLGQEWRTLQDNHEQYERSALFIKLMAVVLAVLFLATATGLVLAGAVLLVLWLQEGIFRTSQARLGDRILQVERLLRQQEHHQGAAFQLHSEWLGSRPGTAGLLREYLRNALRPTVAFPYVVLIGMIVATELAVLHAY